MAGSYNIVTVEGDTWIFNAVVDIDGTPWDFTSYTAKMQVRESSVSTVNLLNLSTSNYITLTSVGGISITVPAGVMAEVSNGRWVYDFEVTSAGGVKTTLLQGAFIISPQVSE
jgi:hypothetical protein